MNKNQSFNIIGMTCASCQAHVEKAVSKLDGVSQVSVNLLKNNMNVEFDNEIISSQDIISAVEKGGYGAELQNDAKAKTNMQAPKADLQKDNMKFRFITSLVFLIPLFYISMGHMMGLPLPEFMHGNANSVTFAFTQFLLCLPVVYVNRNYFINGYKSLFHLAPNMDTLIAVGSSAAIIYGIFAIYRIGWGLGHNDSQLVSKYSMDLYFESAAMILTLITLGKMLEARSKKKTTEAVTSLLDLAPKTALVLRNGNEIEIAVEDVVVGDIVIVKAGDGVAVDGVIIEGTGSIDEAAITGESLPVEKTVGDKAIAATINKSGYFKMQAEKVGEDTTLSQIIHLVEEASATKAPIARLANKISGIFVPIVIGIAALTLAVWLILGASVEFALSAAIAVLVISCPCALGLATPVAIMVGTGTAARHGILVKSAQALELADKINIVAFDKTGTITEGKPTVTDITFLGSSSQDEIFSIAASLEAISNHPLASAILEKAKEINAEIMAVEKFQVVFGQGIVGEINGKMYYLGNQKLISQNNIETAHTVQLSEQFATSGKTPLFLADKEKVLGIIAVADVIKPSSKTAISALKKMGVETVMLTGDNEHTALAICHQLGITRVAAQLMPQDKSKAIEQLKRGGKIVAMAGDGINDAPALVSADVGIAVGAGTDIAIDSADIVLIKNDLNDVAVAIQLSRAVMRNIKENLFWAFIYNVIGIPLAAGVFYTALGWSLNPMFGAAAMSLSSVCVVMNALRLKLFKPEIINKPNLTLMEETVMLNSKKKEDKIIIKINGMSCAHCSAAVEKALNAFEGVTATVNLKKKQAELTNTGTATLEQLEKAIVDAGYEVVDTAK